MTIFCCCCKRKKKENRDINYKKNNIENLNKKILEIKNEINNKKYELYELKLNITKMQNANDSNTKYYNILLKQIQAEKDKTNCLAYEISKEKDLLKKREDYLKK